MRPVSCLMVSVVALSSGCALIDALNASEGDPCLDLSRCDGEPDAGTGTGDPDAAPADGARMRSDAGSDVVVDVGDVVQLDGSQSSGASGYLWELRAPADNSASLSSTNAALTSFVADLEGVYEATLWVYGDGFGYAVDEVTITASVIFGRAGPDRSTYTGTGVTLGDIGEQPTGGSVAYRWSVLSAPPDSAGRPRRSDGCDAGARA
jgi:hypothetical protein